ncbi:MAG: hypothetical protein DMG06_02760 [Acidobacteria bacterium]|nr:MAG: hypothetical protein DMG06_02760 [Acidobacteriota bacterium]
MVNKILVIVFIFFCFELGVFLVIFPWSQYWENNLFLFYLPSIREFVLNNYFRGAVSGLGIVDIGLGLWEVMHFRMAVSQLNHK